MKEDSAKTLLNKIMDWSSPEDSEDEHPVLQALAAFGYDDYQQFEPGMRFIESLAIWLSKFPATKRKVAYEFVKNKLLYISRYQMEHLISTAYKDYIVPSLLKSVSKELGESEWKIKSISNSDTYKINHEQCLFLGLSDGSYIDVFRRSNQNINHEQVFRTHELNSTRVQKMSDELEKRLRKYSAKSPSKYFRHVFLFDDFSASGISYLKEDLTAPCGVKGKIGNFYCSINTKSDPFYNLINQKDLHVYVILYIATQTAKDYLEKLGTKIFKSIPFNVIVIQLIPDSLKFDEIEESAFAELVKDQQYGWENFLDEHIEQGKTTKQYLGFNEGGLPLILHHNTPNNSLPILWRNDSKKTSFQGLFPRISRHH